MTSQYGPLTDFRGPAAPDASQSGETWASVARGAPQQDTSIPILSGLADFGRSVQRGLIPSPEDTADMEARLQGFGAGGQHENATLAPYGGVLAPPVDISIKGQGGPLAPLIEAATTPANYAFGLGQVPAMLAGAVGGQLVEAGAQHFTDNPYIAGGAQFLGGLAGFGAAGGLARVGRGLMQGGEAAVEDAAGAARPAVTTAEIAAMDARAAEPGAAALPDAAPVPQDAVPPTGAIKAWADEVAANQDARAAAGGSEAARVAAQTAPTAPVVAADGATNPAFTALRDALDAEVNLRESGVPMAEIAAGRSRQAGGVVGRLAELGPDATIAERQAAARAGMYQGGGLRETFNQPLELPAETQAQLAEHLQNTLLNQGKSLSVSNGLDALNNLITGQNVQPAQLTMLKSIFGDEIGGLAEQANKARVLPKAVIDAEGEERIARAGQFQEKQIARYEEQAQAQTTHANDLQRQSTMDPTNKRLAATVDAARQMGLDAQNRADALLVSRAQHLAGVPEDAVAALAQQKQTYQAVNMLRQAQAAKVAGTATREQGILLQAQDLLGRKMAVSPAMKSGQLESVDLWLKGNRAILDQIGETTHETLRGIAAKATGDLADSWLTNLYQRKALIEAALTKQGWTDQLARVASGHLIDAELAARYPQGIPERIANEIAKTKLEFGSYGSNILKGAADLSQGYKNIAFGPADVGVFGQQALHAVISAPGQILAGVVNRTLNALHTGLDTKLIDDIALGKRLQYQLDGVPQGISTGIVQEADRGLLGHLGTQRYNIGAGVDKLSDFQFGTILGGLRNLIHEGNLVALHLTGQDITNPAVRATSAAFANSATSYAPAAVNASRALAEKALLLTPSMRRAQVASIMQMGKVFAPGATAAERILGATSIVSLAGSQLAVGKLLNDRIGVKDFEFDPSKPGFGQITTNIKNSEGQNIVISLFPQEQVQTTIARSVRELAESDPTKAEQEWAKLFMSSSSPPAQFVEKAAGYGFDPKSGYRYGDLTGGILNVLPLPPVVQNYLTGQESPQTLPLDVAGVNNFTESAKSAVERGTYDELSGTSQFGAIPAQGWKMLTDTAPPAQKADLQQYASEFEWRQAKVAEFKQQFIDRGLPDAQAQLRAATRVNALPIAQAYGRAKTHLENEWYKANPQAGQERLNSQMAIPNPRDRTNLPTLPQQAIIAAGTR